MEVVVDTAPYESGTNEQTPHESPRRTLYDLAHSTYERLGDSAEARHALVTEIMCHDLEAEALLACAITLLNQQRLARNHEQYRRAARRAEVATLSVEHREPATRERLESLDAVLTGDDQGRGYPLKRPMSAFREALDIKLSKGRYVRHATREELFTHIGVLKVQAQGAIAHAALLADLASVMRKGERALDAVRRLEREANARGRTTTS